MTETPPPLRQWFISTLRVTMFGDPERTSRATDVWKAVFNNEPDEIRQTKSREERCRGQISNRWAITITRNAAGRLDLVQQALVPPNVDFSEFRKLKDFQAVLDDFVTTIASRFVHASSPVTRFALGGVMKIRTNSGPDRQRAFRELLPGVSIDDDLTDLLYRVNRPKELFGMTVNRLSTWQDITEQLVELGPDGVRQGALQPAIQLELDINTDAQRTDEIPMDLLDKLLIGLRDEFQAIARQGATA